MYKLLPLLFFLLLLSACQDKSQIKAQSQVGRYQFTTLFNGQIPCVLDTTTGTIWILARDSWTSTNLPIEYPAKKGTGPTIVETE